jgi:hypothetical protein
MTGDYDATRGDNHKQFYLYGNNSQMPQGMPLIPAGSTRWGFYNNVGDGTVPYSERYNMNSAGWSYSNTSNRFNRWEFWIELNAPYTESNGIIKIWVDGILGVNSNSYRHRYVDGEYIDFRIGHMAQGFTSSAEVWIDDLYISTTQARGELGDNIDYSSCTHREVQIPLSWSNNSISLTINSGSFSNCDSLYLFIIDKNGYVSDEDSVRNGSQGFPVRLIGETSTAPCPPIKNVNDTSIIH